MNLIDSPLVENELRHGLDPAVKDLMADKAREIIPDDVVDEPRQEVLSYVRQVRERVVLELIGTRPISCDDENMPMNIQGGGGGGISSIPVVLAQRSSKLVPTRMAFSGILKWP